MNREGLIRAVADDTDEPLGIVDQIVATALRVIVDELNAGRSVNIEGFGNFYQRHAAATTAPHPHTREPVEHPPYRQLVFRATGEWRSRVNGGRGADAIHCKGMTNAQ